MGIVGSQWQKRFFLFLYSVCQTLENCCHCPVYKFWVITDYTILVLDGL